MRKLKVREDSIFFAKPKHLCRIIYSIQIVQSFFYQVQISMIIAYFTMRAPICLRSGRVTRRSASLPSSRTGEVTNSGILYDMKR